jgi:hypothetical protein
MKSSSVVSFLRKVTVSWEKCSTAMRIDGLLMTALSPARVVVVREHYPQCILASKRARAKMQDVIHYFPDSELRNVYRD